MDKEIMSAIAWGRDRMKQVVKRSSRSADNTLLAYSYDLIDRTALSILREVEEIMKLREIGK